MAELIFRKPDNWHAHLRQEELLNLVVDEFNIYGRVVCMGNTNPPIETGAQALDYRDKIIAQGAKFRPIMTVMLTENTDVSTIYDAADKGIKLVKWIPAATSYAHGSGVRLGDFVEKNHLFKAIIDTNMFLLLHCELAYFSDGSPIHRLKREEKAIPILEALLKKYPELKLTIEHVSGKALIDFILKNERYNLAATLAPQHALFNYSDVFFERDKIKDPHKLCLPVVKLERDRKAVLEAMTSGDPRFFAGTDAAPHWVSNKICLKNRKPGVFFGRYEYLRYLEIFEKEQVLDKFEDFTSKFGAERYGFGLNQESIKLRRENNFQPGGVGIRFCMEGEPLRWRFVEPKQEGAKL